MAAKAADLYKYAKTLDRNLYRRLDEFGGDKGIVEDFINHNIALGGSPARIIKYFNTLIHLGRISKTLKIAIRKVYIPH